MSKSDVKTFKRGLKRMALAVVTAALFATSVFCFIKVATTVGYLAILLFFLAIVAMGMSLLLLYAQGIISGPDTESKGDGK